MAKILIQRTGYPSADELITLEATVADDEFESVFEQYNTYTRFKHDGGLFVLKTSDVQSIDIRR